jgi:hypothetical protein
MACAPFANSGGDPWFGPNLSARHFDSEEILAVKGVGEMIALTTDAAATFLSWLDTRDSGLLQKALEHPGYRAVEEHSRTWGTAITAAHVIAALEGRPSPMYGLKDVGENVDAIRGAALYVEANRDAITGLVRTSLNRLFSPELAYPVGLHCIVGYDWGIGLGGNVAVNLNSRLYLDDLREIGYMLIHEAAHVAYERFHGPMSPVGLERAGGLRHLAATLVQNEGLAVYSALHARTEGGCLGNQDYRFLLNPIALSGKTAALCELLAGIPAEYPGEEAAGRVFNSLSRDRLSYVVGCSAFANLEKEGGLGLVQEAALWTPEEFVARVHLNLHDDVI